MPSPPQSGMPERDPEGEAVGGVQALEAADREVAAVGGDREVGLDGERAGRLDDLELHVQRERRGEGVEPGAEVGRGGGDADEATALHQP